MSPEQIFLLAIILMALIAGPLYMRMLAHGDRPAAWWKERRDGGFLVGLVLLVAGGVCNLIGGVALITLAWLLYLLAAFLLAIAVTCFLVLRRRSATDQQSIEESGQ